ncbi:26S proteasome non ATPase regulatory subunit 8 [Echinococcus multilocularis]|uniref:26S proteasome non-ATPase regulatory subunit 8 n=1 Tax=Echinococcus multilocularis TaxID=6211 RepID=A0A068YAU3_ECHMU|nr:26S proteasome non ATPase regulatory subunit 8 [Echinococcus multilocularis]
MEELVRKFQCLSQEWNKKNHDLSVCQEKLEKLTLDLTRFCYMPNREAFASKRELLIARDTLEIGAILSLEKRDMAAFERYMSQLKCYYCDYKVNLPGSPYKYELFGLNLLRLLAQGRLAEFHTEVERLSSEEINANAYIKHPLSMEQYLMEGSFHKVFLSKGNVPSERYNYFIDILLDATRDEVASCIEAAYEELSVEEATKALFFTKLEQMKVYAKQRQWTQVNGNYVFAKPNKQTENALPATDLAKILLYYTHELEQII